MHANFHLKKKTRLKGFLKFVYAVICALTTSQRHQFKQHWFQQQQKRERKRVRRKKKVTYKLYTISFLEKLNSLKAFIYLSKIFLTQIRDGWSLRRDRRKQK